MLNKPISRRSLPQGVPNRLSDIANDNRRLRLVAPVARELPGRLTRLNPYIGAITVALTLYDYFSNSVPEGWNDLGPWTKYATIPPGFINPLRSVQWCRGSRSTTPNNTTIAGFVNAGLDNQATTDIGDPWAGVLTTSRSVGLGMTDGTGAGARMQYREAYTRPAAGAFTKPTYRPAQAAIVLSPNPAITWRITANPANAKPDQAPAFARPIPWKVLPKLEPQPNRDVSYGNPEIEDFPVPDAPYYPSTVPNDWSVSIDDIPAGQAGQSAPKTHDLTTPSSRPPKREKEVKHKLPTAAVHILKAVSAVTEGLDFVDALYEALPSEYRPRYRKTKHEKLNVTPHEKVKALLEHGENIGIYDAISNLVSNQIEDYTFGKLGQLGGEISRRIGSPYGMGVNTINRKIQKSYYDAANASKARVVT